MTLQHTLATLETAGLVRLVEFDSEIAYMFRHALVQDAAYASLLKQDRRQLHLLVGDTLEQLYADHLGEYAPVLAEHFEKAGDFGRAFQYFVLAGDYATQRYANAEARTLYSQALDLAERAEASSTQLIQIYAACGRSSELQADYGRALELYTALERLADKRQDRAMELIAVLRQTTLRSIYSNYQNIDLALQLAERGLKLAQDLGDRRAEVKALWNYLLLYTYNGDPQQPRTPLEARTYGEQALALARELGLRDELAFVLNDLCTSYRALGEPEQALSALCEAQVLWRDSGNLHMLADNLNSTGSVYLDLGVLDQALECFREAYRISISIHNPIGQARACMFMGLAHYRAGEFDRALAVLEEGITIVTTTNLTRFAVSIALILVWVYEACGAWDEALALVARMQARCPADESTSGVRADLLVAQARFEAHQGRLGAAEQSLAAARTLLAGSKHFSINLPLTERVLAFKRQDYAEVIRLMDQFLADLSPMSVRNYQDGALYYKGRALLSLGEFDAARAVLQAAASSARAARDQPTHLLVLLAQANLEQQAQRSGESLQFQQQARRIVDHLSAHTTNPRLRTSLLQQPDLRQLLELPQSIAKETLA